MLVPIPNGKGRAEWLRELNQFIKSDVYRLYFEGLQVELAARLNHIVMSVPQSPIELVEREQYIGELRGLARVPNSIREDIQTVIEELRNEDKPSTDTESPT